MSERTITIQHMITAWNSAATAGGNTDEQMGAALDVAVAKCREATVEECRSKIKAEADRYTRNGYFEHAYTLKRMYRALSTGERSAPVR